ncbi:hypothetical protein AOX55_0000734 [Sinorhizobium fredii CCBAU 25509]|nr:hypothetical protein AOX55_0000734 [Sinorhizobium fredii CCBAU 25509]
MGSVLLQRKGVIPQKGLIQLPWGLDVIERKETVTTSRLNLADKILACPKKQAVRLHSQ